jgi:outer membrane protein OmpA-like peptidoglycan-associated protein
MSTPIKILLLLLAWLLYTVFAYRGCKEQFCLTCGDDAATGIVVPPDGEVTPQQRFAIDFKWGAAAPIKNEGADEQIKGILAGLTADNLLEVTGFYFEGESKPRRFDNLGFARAEEIKKMLAAAGVPADRIRVRARAIDETEGVREGFFEGFETRWVEPEKKEVVETVQTLADRIIIRFPTGSTIGKYDDAVNTYFDQLAEHVKQSGETITLTGHTDNVGDPDRNMTLGQARADAVKALLLRKGVKPEQITTATKGQTQPVTTNDTEEGRAENRRVEVRLNKTN